MLYKLLKTARNSGESYLAMHAWVDSKRIDPIAELPLPASLFAITHVAATAAMAVVMNKLREEGSYTGEFAGRVQLEQFLCHVMRWSDNYMTVFANRPSEQLLQEWLLEEVSFLPDLFAAK